MIEIRWHGRAGQGVVTAADMFTQVMVVKGKYSQAFPEFGAEKRGAPVCAFNRISDSPILIHSRIKAPSIVCVLDPTLVGHIDICEGTKEGAVIIINTSVDPKDVKEVFKMSDKKVFTVDAYKISTEEIGRQIPNTPMLGALIKASGMLGIDEFVESVKKLMEKKFNPKVVAGNIESIKRAYNEVRL